MNDGLSNLFKKQKTISQLERDTAFIRRLNNAAVKRRILPSVARGAVCLFQDITIMSGIKYTVP
ncbi:MAG: hypothetical protein C4549_00520 [Deltaproteobacteria bacterium]|jgi:hypothetical protein|nr:MAG: hypothetical protein C4549_00520 [Deltaproteobacteria bacterium]